MAERQPNPQEIQRLPSPSDDNHAAPRKIELDESATVAGEIPHGFGSWWETSIAKPLRSDSERISIDVESLVLDALRYSPRVHAINKNAAIRQTAITEAMAQFDVHAFMESKFVRTSEPTGTTLDAGINISRLREEDWFYSAGVRRKNQLGGQFEVSQQIGLRDSNSTFFTPVDQGNSRFTLNYTQPILNGFGQAYNRSLIVLAEIDTRSASARTSLELQDHLFQVMEVHWQLYLQRAALLQKQEHLERGLKILAELEARRDVDTLTSQIARAKAAVANRRTQLIRASATIRNAEARLRSLVNAPTLLANRRIELIPTQLPMKQQVPINLDDALVTALKNRPEIDEAMQEVKASCIRLKMAKRELLPVLDFVVESYLSGLDGQFDIGSAYLNQFRVGEPGYAAGFTFEVPLYNRAARARHQRRELELQQIRSQFQATVETLKAEVEVAVRDVDTAYREMQGKYHSMKAAENDIRFLRERWELLPGEDRPPSFLLEDLLAAQDRLMSEEFDFAKTQFDYTVSLARLKKATGTLLKHEHTHANEPSTEPIPASLEETGQHLTPPTLNAPNINRNEQPASSTYRG